MSRFLPVRSLLATLPLILLSGLTRAGDAMPLESILVTANAPSEGVASHLDRLDILSASDIRLQQPLDIHQLLDGIEGVYASREGGPGGVNSLAIRGAEPNFAVVLIDGVPVNDPTNVRGGSFDLATLSSDHVRRVEVTKGPRSLAYGSDALAGVVKLITAPGSEVTTGLRLYQEVQEYAAFRRSGDATLANDSHALSLQGTKEDSGTVWEGSSRELSEAAAHYRLNLDQALLQIGGREAEFTKSAYPEQSGGPQFAQSDARDRSEGEDQTAYLSGEVSLSDSWRLAAQYSEYNRVLDYYSPGIVPYDNVPENFYVADYQRQQWRLVSDVSWAGWNLNLGVDRRWEEGISDGAVVFPNIPVDALGFLLGLPSPPVETGAAVPISLALDTDYRLRRTTEGRFVEVNWQSDNAFVLSAGLRRDDSGGSSSSHDRAETVRRYLVGIPLDGLPVVGALFADGGRINMSYSEGFKLPSFFALGHGLVGNPDLKPERVESYQLDFSSQWGRLGVELGLFATDYLDLIDFDAEAFTNVNRNRVSSRGGELSLQLRLQQWSLRGSVSHVNIDIENSDRNLANRPQNTASLEINWQPGEQFSWHNRVRWIDEQFATSMHTGESREYVLDDYALWDTALRWDASAAVSLTLGVENVANARYEEAVGFPGAGRLLRLGLAFSL